MDYIAFNLFEALFWITLGSSLYMLRNLKRQKYKELTIYMLVVFILFGLSDVAEVLYGNFLMADQFWLLVWKIVNVCAIIYGVNHFLFSRTRE